MYTSIIHWKQWKNQMKGGSYGKTCLLYSRGSRSARHQQELRLRTSEEGNNSVFGTWKKESHSKGKI